MSNEKRKAYIAFMYNPANAGDCENCPANIGLGGNGRYECGQYHCWVDIHCAQQEEVQEEEGEAE